MIEINWYAKFKSSFLINATRINIGKTGNKNLGIEDRVGVKRGKSTESKL